MNKVVAICDHLQLLGFSQLKHEVGGETPKIAFYLLIQPFGFHAVKFSQIAIQHHPLASNGEDCPLNSFHRNPNHLPFHFSPFSERWSQTVTTLYKNDVCFKNLKSQFVTSSFLASITARGDARPTRLILCGRQFFLKIHDLLDLNQEPAVNLRQVENLVNGEAGAQGVADEKNPFGVGHAQFATDDVARQDVAVAIDFVADAPGFAVTAQTVTVNLQRAQAFLQAFLERAADRHRFAHAFHLRRQRRVGLREFLEGEPRNLGDDVINRRLEAGRGFARDVVADFVEQVADGEFGGDFRDGKAGGLGRQRRAAAHARVHLNDDHAAVVRVDGELNVRATGLHAHGADDGETLVPHDLKFLVGERLDGRDGDGIASVDAHGIDVFDGTNYDAVVGLVAHDFHLEFLPAEERFFDEDFRDGRKLHAAFGEGVELVAVVGDATAGAAERERGPDDDGKTANLFRHGAGLLQVVRGAADGHIEADGNHEVFEDLPVFAAFDGLSFGAN